MSHPRCDKNPEHGPLHYFWNANTFACLKCDEWRDDERCGTENCATCAGMKLKSSKPILTLVPAP